MTELDAALVRRKLAAIRRNLDDLAAVERLTLEQYRKDRFRLKGTERLLQETVEAAVDANLRLLRAAGATTPGDYFMSFVELGRAGRRDRARCRPRRPARLRRLHCRPGEPPFYARSVVRTLCFSSRAENLWGSVIRRLGAVPKAFSGSGASGDPSPGSTPPST